MYRIVELKHKNIEELNDKNMNDLIRMVLGEDVFDLQEEYDSRASCKEDLKALSSFRNIIVHFNKKLETSIDYETLIKRKKQILKLLPAIQQIIDNLKRQNNKS